MVLYCDLDLRVRVHPWTHSSLSHFCESLYQAVTQHVREGHHLWSLICSVTYHQALITCSDLLDVLVHMDSISYLLGLLINSHNHCCQLIVKSLLFRI